MATFVQVTEEDTAYSLVVILNSLKDTPEEAEKKEQEDFDDMAFAQSSELGKLVAAGKYQQLLDTGLLPALDKILASSDETIEAAFTLAFSIVQQNIEEKNRDAFVTKLTSTLSQAKFSSPLLSLDLLSLLFNSLPDTNKRFPVLMTILNRTVELKCPEVLQDQFEHVEEWWTKWGLEDSQVAELCDVAFGLAADETRALSLKTEYLKRMENSPDRASAHVGDVATSVCLSAIQAFKTEPSQLDFAQLQSLGCVQDMAKGKHAPLYQLLDIFANKEIGDYLALHKTQAAYLAAQGLVHEDLLCKLRTLTLCDRAVQTGVMSFDSLVAALKLDSKEEVESAVIDAVVSGRFEGKIDQHQETVTVLRTTKRSFAEADWAMLGEKVNVWRDNVNAVLKNLHNIQMSEQ